MSRRKTYPGIVDVAREAQVSPSTVSRTFSLVTSAKPLRNEFSMPRTVSDTGLRRSRPSRPSRSSIILFCSLSPISAIPRSRNSSAVSSMSACARTTVCSSPTRRRPK